MVFSLFIAFFHNFALMKRIVITLPTFIAGEAERICSLLRGEVGEIGMVDFVHVRKPGAGADELRTLLESIPQEYRDRLTLHDHMEMATDYGIGGLHLNGRNPVAPDGWRGRLSCSCHSLEELATRLCASFDYLSLSPIFDSISKVGYQSAFTSEELKEAQRRGVICERVVALGGVTPEHLPLLQELGFGGAMMLGCAWKNYS